MNPCDIYSIKTLNYSKILYYLSNKYFILKVSLITLINMTEFHWFLKLKLPKFYLTIFKSKLNKFVILYIKNKIFKHVISKF